MAFGPPAVWAIGKLVSLVGRLSWRQPLAIEWSNPETAMASYSGKLFAGRLEGHGSWSQDETPANWGLQAPDRGDNGDDNRAASTLDNPPLAACPFEPVA